MKVIAALQTPVHVVETATARVHPNNCAPAPRVVELKHFFGSHHQRTQCHVKLNIASEEIVHDDLFITAGDDTP